MAFCTVTGESTPLHIIEIAQAANEALRGETYTTGVVDVTEGETVVTVRDARCGGGEAGVPCSSRRQGFRRVVVALIHAQR